MKKSLLTMVAVVLCLCMFAGCSTDAPSGGGTQTDAETASNEVFKIGATGPLTGGAAIYGIAAKQGAELAAAEINALGGLQFEINYQDDEHDAEKAVNAYNALQDWGMQIFLSSVTSTPAVATAVEAFEDRVFGLTPSASSTAVLEGNDNIYQMCFADPNQGSATAQYVADNYPEAVVAVIYKNDDVYSKGVYDTFAAAAKELELNIVSETTFTEDSQQDFSVQIADAQNAGADFVFLPMYYQPASLIFAQANAVGYNPTYFGIDGMDGILTLEGFDTSLAEGVMLLTPFSADAQDDKTVNFVTKYQEQYGETPNQFAADGYDCVYAIYEAIQSSDGAITVDMEAPAICEELIAIFNGGFSFDGVTGAGMTWNENGEVSKSPTAVVIQDGVYVGVK